MSILISLIGACQSSSSLIVIKEMNVYRSFNADGRPDVVIYTATAGESFNISDCQDMKSFFLLKIKLPSGEEGFVRDGDFKLNGTPDCH